MVVSYLALITAVPLVPFDTGLARTLRKAGTRVLAPEILLKIYLLFLINDLENLAVGSSRKICLAHAIFFYSKLFAVRFSSFGSEQHTHKPCRPSLVILRWENRGTQSTCVHQHPAWSVVQRSYLLLPGLVERKHLLPYM